MNPLGHGAVGPLADDPADVVLLLDAAVGHLLLPPFELAIGALPGATAERIRVDTALAVTAAAPARWVQRGLRWGRDGERARGRRPVTLTRFSPRQSSRNRRNWLPRHRPVGCGLSAPLPGPASAGKRRQVERGHLRAEFHRIREENRPNQAINGYKKVTFTVFKRAKG